jgi:cell division protein FtsW
MAREAKVAKSLAGSPVMPDYPLFSVAMVLVCAGLFMVLDASFARASATGDPYVLFRQQSCWAAAGMVGMLGAMYFPYWKLMRCSIPIMGLAIGLLCLVWLPHIGVQSHGAHRWLRLLMVTGPRWQPSEFAKIGVILYRAAYPARRPKAIKCWSPGLVGALFPTLLAVLLIAKEPDMGTACIVFVTVMVMLAVAGARPRHLGSIIVVVLALAVWHTK